MPTCSIVQMKKAALLAILLASATVGAQNDAAPQPKQPILRSLYLSKSPNAVVSEVYVAGRVVTTLRFEVPCDSSRTKLMDWEGRFEPLLVGGKSVVIVPLQDLAPEDRFHLLVTFVDGTSLPFTLTAHKYMTDGQVNVFPDRESPEAVRTAYAEVRQQNEELREKNRRYKKEETSVEHALATLLVTGATSLTPFREGFKWTFNDSVPKTDAQLFSGAGRKALLFTVTNRHPELPWKLVEVRVTSAATGSQRTYGLRMQPSSIAPGETGRIAVVMNPPTRKEKNTVYYVELYGDYGVGFGSFRQAYLVVDLQER
jgi:uncharacterized protein (TIGR02268 family)